LEHSGVVARYVWDSEAMRISWMTTFLFTGTCLQAQHVLVGMKLGGVPAHAFSGGTRQLSDESKHYTIGPSIEMQYTQAFSLEFSPLYRHVGYDGDSSFIFVSKTRERDRSWEFPIVAKYRVLTSASVHPFLSGGVATRVMSGSATEIILSTPFPNFAPPMPTTVKTKYSAMRGFIVGGGLEFGAGQIRFTPEVRYSRWNRHFLDLFAQAAGRSTTPNQVQILLGISWTNQN
jgi:hypothetical protein